MKIHYYQKIAFLFFLFFSSTHKLFSYHSTPKLTIIIVIDQFAYDYFYKLSPYLKHGIKYLLDNGVVYTNAYHPHGYPATAAGHAGLNSGAYAKDHGFINNKWYTQEGKKIECDDDDDPATAVFSPDGVYDHGKSPQYLMTDGLSDRFVMQSKPDVQRNAVSISLKSRAAIATAGELGKAIWFDETTGNFTSSKAYFDTLPEWIHLFNQQSGIDKLEYVYWEKAYPMSKKAYNFYLTEAYQYTRLGQSLIGRKLPVGHVCKEEKDNLYYYFEKTPYANQVLFDLAKNCIDTHVNRKNKDQLLLWLCLSPLDKLGHKYGPNSLECIDMIYHLDKQLQRFIRYVLRAVGKDDLLIALTGDHGSSPSFNLLKDIGIKKAGIVDETDLVDEVNAFIEQNYKVANMIIGYDNHQLYFNQSLLNTFYPKQQKNIFGSIKRLVKQNKKVKEVWTFDELQKSNLEPYTIESNLKNQLFEGRSGQIIIQTYPNTHITEWKEGGSHDTPYNSDTHVPIIIFYPGRFERKHIRERVYTLQLANTFAEILNVPKPSSSTFNVLPGLFDPELP